VEVAPLTRTSAILLGLGLLFGIAAWAIATAQAGTGSVGITCRYVEAGAAGALRDHAAVHRIQDAARFQRTQQHDGAGDRQGQAEHQRRAPGPSP